MKNKQIFYVLIAIVALIIIYFSVMTYFNAKDRATLPPLDQVPGQIGTGNGSDGSVYPPANPSATDVPTPTPLVSKTSVTLKLNEDKKVGNAVLLATSIIEDSRCPSDVRCIQAGRVVVAVSEDSPKTSTRSIRLEIDKPYNTKDLTLTLKAVTPYPLSTHEIQDNEYRFVINVEPITSGAPGSSPSPSPTPTVATGKCYVGGCSSEVCSDQPNTVSNCIYTASYACYKNATCERQATGKCGWTQTPELKKCISDANQNGAQVQVQ